MNFFNNFISWKKNIKRIPLTGYSFSLDPKLTDIETMYCDFEDLAKNSNVYKLNNVFEKNLFKISHGEDLSKVYFYPDSFNFNDIIGKNFQVNLRRVFNRTNVEILSADIIFESNEILNQELLLKLAGLKYIIMFNPHYKFWDSHYSPDTYKYKGGINTYYNELFHTKMVDISSRPGRFTWKNDLFFHGGSEYWFGNSFFNSISKESLLQFDSCDLVEELENGFVHVKLFDLLDYWEDENQARLANFRKVLKIDE